MKTKRGYGILWLALLAAREGSYPQFLGIPPKETVGNYPLPGSKPFERPNLRPLLPLPIYLFSWVELESVNLYSPAALFSEK